VFDDYCEFVQNTKMTISYRRTLQLLWREFQSNDQIKADHGELCINDIFYVKRHSLPQYFIYVQCK